MREENHEDGLSVFHFDADGAAVFLFAVTPRRGRDRLKAAALFHRLRAYRGLEYFVQLLESVLSLFSTFRERFNF